MVVYHEKNKNKTNMQIVVPGLFILVFLFQEKILLERSEHLTKDASKIKANIKIVIEVCFCGFFLISDCRCLFCYSD